MSTVVAIGYPPAAETATAATAAAVTDTATGTDAGCIGGSAVLQIRKWWFCTLSYIAVVADTNVFHGNIKSIK
jgi:hypothetical protein